MLGEAQWGFRFGLDRCAIAALGAQPFRHPPERMAAMARCKEPDCAALIQRCFRAAKTASVFLRPGLPPWMARRCSRLIPVILEIRLSGPPFSHSRNCGDATVWLECLTLSSAGTYCVAVESSSCS